MGEFLLNLFNTDGFPRRWQCGHGWADAPWLGYLHIVSDLAVWGAYVAIPVVLAYFVLRKSDIPFPKVVWLFVAFIFACGTTHLVEAIIFEKPIYRFAGAVKAFTAVVSWATVFALIPLTPKVLAMKSPRELEREIAERRRAEEELRKAQNELERRVEERTAELAAANAALETENAERRRTEERYRAQSRTLATLNRVNASLAGELDQDRLVQAITDAGTQLSGAQFGAFFYNVLNERGESYTLYTLSGVPREEFETFPMPRATDLFAPTFCGEGIIRLADVIQDPRYGRNAPGTGMPEGHLPVRSYLAAPVVSRSGEVLGGLFFGHEAVGVFDESAEELIAGVAAQAAVALDNARLYQAAQEELAERGRAEAALAREHAATELERSRLRAVLDLLPVAVFISEADGKFVDLNSMARDLWGASAAPRGIDDYTRNYRAWWPSTGKRVEPHEWGLVRALSSGESRLAEEMEIETADGRRKTILDYALPIRGRDGAVTGGVAVKVDITERKRTERAMAFLAEASNVLASSLDYSETLAAVARLAVPEVADWCAVDVVEEDGTLQRLATAHVDPAKVELAREFHRRYPPDPDAPHGTAAVLRTGLPDVMTEIPDELIERSAKDEEHLRLLRELGLKSYICAPLTARGRPLGALTFVSAESGRRYAEADLGFAQEVARRAAMAVDNARLYRAAQRELAERKRSEEQLRESEERYRTLFDTMDEGFCIIEVLFDVAGNPVDYRFLETNPAFARQTGLKDVVGRTMRELAPGLEEYWFQTYGRIALTGRPERFISEARQLDGRWYDVYALRVGAPEDRKVAVLFNDITARRRAEQALRESEERLRLVNRATNDAIWDWDLASHRVVWNESVRTLFGYREDQVGPDSAWWYEHIHPDDRGRVVGGIHAVIDGTGSHWTDEYRFLRTDGSYASVIDRGHLVRDPAGRPLRMIGAMLDITARKHDEELLARRARLAALRADVAVTLAGEDRLPAILRRCTELLVQHLGVAFARIWTLPPAGNILELQASAGLYTHLNGPHSRIAVGEYKIGRIAQGRQALLTNDVPNDPNVSDPDWARREGMVAFAGFPLAVEGRVVGVLGAFSRHSLPQDVIDELAPLADGVAQCIERKRAEEALQRANDELQQKNRELAQFVYIVSHDLKSPLVTLTGFVGLLKEDLAAGRVQEAADSMERITRATRRMSDLIDDLLELSRVGRVRNEPELVDVAAVLRDLGEQLSGRLTEAGAALEIGEGLPPVVCDRARLTEVFDNLLTNAAKYGCDGPDRRVVVGARRVPGKVRYFVRDFGRGIEPQYHEKIFGLFQRLDTTKEGTGVGLAIVRRIMEVHGGRVWVESALGEGTTFWLELPETPAGGDQAAPPGAATWTA